MQRRWIRTKIITAKPKNTARCKVGRVVDEHDFGLYFNKEDDIFEGCFSAEVSSSSITSIWDATTSFAELTLAVMLAKNKSNEKGKQKMEDYIKNAKSIKRIKI